jgi:hypothetical protein
VDDQKGENSHQLCSRTGLIESIALDTVALASKFTPFTRHFRNLHVGADFETRRRSRVAGCVTQQGPLATDIAMVWVGEIVVKVLSADDVRCVALLCSLLRRMHSLAK